MKLYRVLGREGKITIPHAMRQHIGFGASDTKVDRKSVV